MKRYGDIYGGYIYSGWYLNRCQKWFVKFRFGDLDVNDAPRSSRLNEIDSRSDVKIIIDESPSQSVREIATALNISHTSGNHLEYISRLNVWVPHKLIEANLARVFICDSLRKRQKNDPFLKRMVTSNEKWIVYNNVMRKRSWEHSSELPQITLKAGLHPKIMLSVWWDFKSVIYYELLPSCKTIDSTVYFSQLTELDQVIRTKRRENDVLARVLSFITTLDSIPHWSSETNWLVLIGMFSLILRIHQT